MRPYRSYCLAGNWNIQATTAHERAECGPVEVTLLRTRPTVVMRRYRDVSPRFVLFGDNPVTGNVYGNAQAVKPLILVKGQRYCVESREPQATGYTELSFTQAC
jgi:hypothetical protein